jgi:archaellum biogenesis protein FlaJ (TadC family)
MNKELLTNLNPLNKVDFESRYVVMATITMAISAIILVCLIIFGNLNNDADYTIFLTVAIVDGCLFIDIISNILPPTEAHIKNKELKKEE